MLRDLRAAMGITQQELARRMGRRQPALSRVERQRDAHVATVREYVEALGGELELTALIKGRRVAIRQFEEEKDEPSTLAPTLEYVRSRREDILRVAEQHGVYNVRVFGSVVRGESTPESDIDFLIDMEEGRSGFEFVRLIDALSAALARPVDVVEAVALHWHIRDRVLREARPL